MEPETPRPHVRVIDSLWTFAIATATVGPLALPLLWRNPRFTRKTKILVSIGVILFTIALTVFAGVLIQWMTRQAIDLSTGP